MHVEGFGIFNDIHLQVEVDSRQKKKEEKSFLASRLFQAQDSSRNLPRVSILAAPISNDVEQFLPAIQ